MPGQGPSRRHLGSSAGIPVCGLDPAAAHPAPTGALVPSLCSLPVLPGPHQPHRPQWVGTRAAQVPRTPSPCGTVSFPQRAWPLGAAAHPAPTGALVPSLCSLPVLPGPHQPHRPQRVGTRAAQVPRNHPQPGVVGLLRGLGAGGGGGTGCGHLPTGGAFAPEERLLHVQQGGEAVRMGERCLAWLRTRAGSRRRQGQLRHLFSAAGKRGQPGSSGIALSSDVHFLSVSIHKYKVFRICPLCWVACTVPQTHTHPVPAGHLSNWLAEQP
jgi:hypothetical protein